MVYYHSGLANVDAFVRDQLDNREGQTVFCGRGTFSSLNAGTVPDLEPSANNGSPI